jgi:ABC-type Fe3+/spermidine/putrescine transport system ATPase subunit
LDKNMIEIKNVSKWYGPVQVLTDCSVNINKGDVVVVCGPSGSGKSTLIKTVNALEPVQKGEITVDGISVTSPTTDLPKLRSRVGMVFQHFELFPHLSVTENLTIAQMKVLGRSGRRCQGPGSEDAGARRSHGPQGQVSRPALGRSAAARGHCPGPVDGPHRDAVRRAHLGTRPRNGGRSAGRDGDAWPTKA